MVALSTANFGLREEIKAYWSDRAENFDDEPGHAIVPGAEEAAWQQLMRRHLGEGGGRMVLDLASGTGVVSLLLDGLGWRVTGLDWSEPMLERARQKAKAQGRNIRFLTADAERTMEPDQTYDAVVTRHLVWTLVDPVAAFREWHRVLRPGGRLLLVDGDFVNQSRTARALAWFSELRQTLRAQGPAELTQRMRTHRDILSRVHFADGARAEEIARMLAEAGFIDIRIEKRLWRIHAAQRRSFGLSKWLERVAQHRYAISATRPD
ncbi:methyltransferase domain-containing protein [Fulvimarina sp. MAC8]|uniref:class I SAM-dependent methyltransferase n=1 Tax=Fulvimarina sp. MAC8 TaxID=3162874 RepID=UPI0032EEE7E9